MIHEREHLISSHYRQLNAELHETNEKYGSKGHKAWVLYNRYGAGLRTVLDYGCGKGNSRGDFMPDQGIDLRLYDPAVPEFEEMPQPADLVICRDVMEHVEPGKVDNVLDHIRDLAVQRAIFLIVTEPSREELPDGRNAHICVEPWSWWVEKLSQRWFVRSYPKNVAVCLSDAGGE